MVLNGKHIAVFVRTGGFPFQVPRRVACFRAAGRALTVEIKTAFQVQNIALTAPSPCIVFYLELHL